MQALVLAGGLGTRLRSIDSDKPKPMVQIENKPFFEFQLELLRNYRVAEMVICVGYLNEQIRAYFGDGDTWGVKIRYSIEDRLLGTAGALKNAQKFVKGTFLVLNGDSYFDLNLAQLIQFHENRRTEYRSLLGTIALKEVSDAGRYGSVRIDDENTIYGFEEKSEQLTSLAQINAGIYVLEPAIFDFIPPARKVSLERETFPSVLAEGLKLLGYPADGFFVDIGTPEGYHRFQDYIQGKQA